MPEVKQAHCGHWIRAEAATDFYWIEQTAVHTETGMRKESREHPVYLCGECAKKAR